MTGKFIAIWLPISAFVMVRRRPRGAVSRGYRVRALRALNGVCANLHAGPLPVFPFPHPQMGFEHAIADQFLLPLAVRGAGARRGARSVHTLLPMRKALQPCEAPALHSLIHP
jgi:hypothetical protein